ncbi:MAG: glycosyltransferase family 4 protein [Bacteroidia bacterium]|nr:glycosyltransferase family 4 protein [Bacteroidia bacterium]
MPNKVVLFGPGPQFKGGISNYNTSLARAIDKFQGWEVYIVSWTQQYPAIIPRDFIDRSSRSNLLEGTQIQVVYVTNYNNPLSWLKTVKIIQEINPQKIVFQWAIALQGLPMGFIARKLYHSTQAEIIFDLHLVVQKEASLLDKLFTNYGLKVAHTYVTHAHKTADELETLFPKISFKRIESGIRFPKPTRTILKLYHPVYDMFREDPNFDIPAFKQKMGLKKHVFLFFGFIRKYKGLHHVIPAFAKVAEKRNDVSLLIVGESFWKTLDQTKFSTRLKQHLFGLAKKIFLRNSDDESNYQPLSLIETYHLQENVRVVNSFVPNEEVHQYFQVSDAIVTYYLTATPSGVESLAYNFKMPVLATRVGHFPETIQDGYNGYLAEPENIDSMADTMLRFLESPINRENVAQSAQTMSWENYAACLLEAKK